MIIAKIGESTQEYTSKLKNGYIEMKAPRPSGYFVAASGGEWIDDSQAIAEAEQAWVVDQLEQADQELKYTVESSSRARYSTVELYLYKESLRDHVTNTNGELSIVGDRPTL